MTSTKFPPIGTFEKLAHPEENEAVEILGRIREAAFLATYKQFTQQPNPNMFAAGCLGTGNDWAVEMLTSTVKPGTVALGKHLRVLVKNVQVDIESLSNRIPIYVTTPRGRWLVDLDNVTFLGK